MFNLFKRKTEKEPEPLTEEEIRRYHELACGLRKVFDNFLDELSNTIIKWKANENYISEDKELTTTEEPNPMAKSTEEATANDINEQTESAEEPEEEIGGDPITIEIIEVSKNDEENDIKNSETDKTTDTPEEKPEAK